MNPETASWFDLITARRGAPPEMQEYLAPYEHRAYARETVAESPWMAPVFALMTPGYQAYKVMRSGARTPPSMRQLQQGLLGTVEGLKQGLLQ